MRDESPLAAVLGDGANGYDAVRSLVECGIPTVLVSERLDRNSSYFGVERHLSPDPTRGEDLAQFLNERVFPDRRVALVPASDAFALWLAVHAHRLDKRLLFLVPGAELTEELHDKARFHALCRRSGVPCPGTLVLREAADFPRGAADLRFPCIAKPLHSRGWGGSVGYKVQRVTSLDGLRRLAEDVWSAGSSLLVQEDVPGGPDRIYFVGGLYDETGSPERVFMGQKLLQFPLYLGSTCAARLVWKAEIAEAADRFARQVGLRGLVDIEFKWDERDDVPKIIEVNPRNGLWHRISHDGRWNITAYYYGWLTGQADRMRDYRPHCEGRRWLFPHRYLCSSVEAFGLARGMVAWLRELARTRLRCGSSLRDFRLSLRHLRIALGHVRRLDLATLWSGRGGAAAPPEALLPS